MGRSISESSYIIDSKMTEKSKLLSGYSVVIPVYNSEGILQNLVERLVRTMSTFNSEYEIIFVNDGSTDRSWDVLCQLSQGYSIIRTIDLMRNYGQHNALLCGIRVAKYEFIITIDDDLQNPPEEIPKLVEKLNEGYDVVYGAPQKKQHGLWRNIASSLTKISLQSALGAENARNLSAFRVFRTHVRDAFARYQSPFVSIDVLLSWGTTLFSVIPVHHDLRKVGESSYTFRKLLIHALNMMTGFSVLPLQLATLIGFVFTLFGIGVLVFVIGRYLLEGGSVPGFPFLACIITIFSGAQLFSLGLMGEYMARMHFRTMEKPPYAIRASSDEKIVIKN